METIGSSPCATVGSRPSSISSPPPTSPHSSAHFTGDDLLVEVFGGPVPPACSSPQEATTIEVQCPVSTCTFHGASLQKHWTVIHTDMTLIHQCIVQGCKYEHVRVDRVRAHAASAHHDAFKNREDQVAQLRQLGQALRPNLAFIDPAGTPPPRGQRDPKVTRHRTRIVSVHPDRAQPSAVPEQKPTTPPRRTPH